MRDERRKFLQAVTPHIHVQLIFSLEDERCNNNVINWKKKTETNLYQMKWRTHPDGTPIYECLQNDSRRHKYTTCSVGVFVVNNQMKSVVIFLEKLNSNRSYHNNRYLAQIYSIFYCFSLFLWMTRNQSTNKTVIKTLIDKYLGEIGTNTD